MVFNKEQRSVKQNAKVARHVSTSRLVNVISG